jgi:pseudouridine synthase
MHPSYSVPKVYHVRVREDIDPKHLKTKKVELEDGVLEIESIQKLDKSPYSKQSGNWVQVTIGVGRNRIVRRLVKHWGYSLLELLRAQLGSVKLDENSKPGDLYRLDSVQAEAIVK